MKKRLLALLIALVLVVMVCSVVLAGGSIKGTFVKFLYYDQAGTEYYCEGYFKMTGSGTVHEWRKNPECINWGMPTNAFHLIFKPTDKFEQDGWEVKGEDAKSLYGCLPYEFVLDETYVEMEGDEGDLVDFFGDKTYWSCVFQWNISQ